MSKKQTTPQQFKELVNFMLEHPDIGRGVSQQRPEIQNSLWDELTQKLNSISLPSRDTTAWKKVWRDFKANTKKKMVTNKQHMMGTGGGPNKTVPLNDLEEAVSELLNLTTSVSGIPNINSFGIPEEIESSLNISNTEIEVISNYDFEHYTQTDFTDTPNSSAKKRKVEQPYLLKTQIELQKTFFENYIKLKREELDYLKIIAEGINKIIKN